MVDLPVVVDANALLAGLVGGEDLDVQFPSLNDPLYSVPPMGTDGMYATVSPINLKDVTEGKIGGTGVFDQLMVALKAYLDKEYSSNRITGEQYTKAYIALVEGAMAQGMAFVMGREQAYWGAVAAQQAAQRAQVELATSRIQLEQAKIQVGLLRSEAVKSEAEAAAARIRLVSEEINRKTADYNYTNILPLQKQTAEKQIALAQGQVDMLPTQKKLLEEQVNAAMAQTTDKRSDNKDITGVLGKQRQLYDQQIDSYKKDAQNKAIKVFTDAWVTMKTIDEGLAPPSAFNNTSLDAMLKVFKETNGLPS